MIRRWKEEAGGRRRGYGREEKERDGKKERDTQRHRSRNINGGREAATLQGRGRRTKLSTQTVTEAYT